MSTKFAVPLLVLGLAVFGCSSSDEPNTGKGGSGGSGTGRGGSGGGTAGTGGTMGSGGTGGTAGAGGATAGSGGGTAGAGGATAGSGGGTAGAGGTAGGAGGAAGASALGQAKSKCMSDTAYNTSGGAGIFTAAEFCALYIDTCADQSPPTGYTTETLCLASWTTVMTTGGTQPHCRTYHLCNAQAQAGNDVTHCKHATGMELCM
jgi:hypothetical protein